MTNHLLQIASQAPSFFTWDHTLAIICAFGALTFVGLYGYTFYSAFKALNSELLLKYSEKKH